MSSFDGIKITPSEDTKRKLAAYACLTNQKIDEVLGQAESMLNRYVSQQIIEQMGGEPVPVVSAKEPLEPVRAHKPRPVQVREEKVETREEEAFEFADDGQHQLSDDEDTQENKSLAEQVDEEEDVSQEDLQEFQRAFKGRRVIDVGKNAEAFLDSAMGEPEDRDTDEMPTVTAGYAGNGVYGERPVKATKSFESRMRKGYGARVSPHTGDED